MDSDPNRALLAEMSASSDRLELMVADPHPTDETDPAKAELVANLKGELASLRLASTNSNRQLEGRPPSAWPYASYGSPGVLTGADDPALGRAHDDGRLGGTRNHALRCL